MASESLLTKALRKLALAHPGTEEGIACAGTAVESRTIRVGGKAFLFLRPTELRLKLSKSLPEARKLAGKDPSRCEAGAGGWVKLTLRSDEKKPAPFLAAWIAESYGLFAPAKKR
jgi:hypothetical protein